MLRPVVQQAGSPRLPVQKAPDRLMPHMPAIRLLPPCSTLHGHEFHRLRNVTPALVCPLQACPQQHRRPTGRPFNPAAWRPQWSRVATFSDFGSTAAAAAIALPFINRMALGDDPIKVGCLLDRSGPIGISGQPMLQATEYAVDQINAKGGLLKRPIELINYDTQSSMQLYTQYAQQLALKDKVAVVHGGITSASREAIRPVFDRFKTLYFYNTQYEGGVCDRNIFCVGTTPAQTVSKLVPYTMKNWGKKAYIIAADYNYGQITAKWMTKYVREAGGSVVATDFFPLDVTNFSSAISKIQSAAPDVVLSAMVGANHLGFYRQWDAAGMKPKIPIASSTFGLANELRSMDVSTTNGILTSYGYYEGIPAPESQAFIDGMKKKFGADLPQLGELDSASYEGMMLWAAGVTKAGIARPDESHRGTGKRHFDQRAVRQGHTGSGHPPCHPQHLPGQSRQPEMGHPGDLSRTAARRHGGGVQPDQGSDDQQAVRRRRQNLRAHHPWILLVCLVSTSGRHRDAGADHAWAWASSTA